MENEIVVNKPSARIKKFWNAHKTKILVGTTVVTATVATIQAVGIRQHDEFLREKDLYDEFYTLNEFDEED